VRSASKKVSDEFTIECNESFHRLERTQLACNERVSASKEVSHEFNVEYNESFRRALHAFARKLPLAPVE
jgi:hypothetical protein